MPARVFICYASQDRAVAERLCASLEGAGVPCWIAPRDIRSGESYAGAIVDAIEGAAHFIIMFSKDANVSRHVHNEVEGAFNQGLALHPLRLDDTALGRELKYFLSRPQWFDLQGPELEARIDRFTSAFLQREAASPAPETAPSEPAPAAGPGTATAAPAARPDKRSRPQAMPRAPRQKSLETSAGAPPTTATTVPAIVPANIRIVRALAGSKGSVQSVAFSPDGTLIASGCAGGFISHPTLHLWRARDGKLLRTFESHTSGVETVAFSPDGSLLAAGDQFGVTTWPIPKGAAQQSLAASFVNDVAFSPDGRLIAAASHPDPAENESGLDIWRVASGRLLGRLPGHSNHVLAVAFSPSGEVLASGGMDETIRLWHVGDRTLTKTLRNARGTVSRLIFLPDGKSLLAAGGDKGLLAWDPATGACRTFTPVGSNVVHAALSPCGATIATACTDGKIRFYRSADRRLLATAEGPARLLSSNACRAVAFAPDGLTLASAWDDKQVRIWALT